MAAKILTKGCAGYYSKLVQIKVPGTNDQIGFKIRELDDDLRKEVRDAPKKLIATLRQFGADEQMLERMATTNPEARQAALGDLLDQFLGMALRDDRVIDAINEAQVREEKRMVRVVASGLLNFPDEVEFPVDEEDDDPRNGQPPVTEQTVAALPRWLQVELHKVILNDSGLSEGEADFLGRSLAG